MGVVATIVHNVVIDMNSLLFIHDLKIPSFVLHIACFTFTFMPFFHN
jgi:hypothetical protein